MKKLIAIAGPTASGKTDLSIRIAQKLNTEILSADSRQIFCELNIGVARPSPEQLNQVTHHFIASHSIHDPMSAGVYGEMARAKLDHLFQKYDTLVLAGGSGLYIQAVCEGFDAMPELNSSVREELNAQLGAQGFESLLRELEKNDPEYFQEVDRKNPQRVIRALEVIRGSGKKFSEYRQNKKKASDLPFQTIKIGIDVPRELLYERINQRTDAMFEAGLTEEVKGLIPFQQLQALHTVGYTELFSSFDGTYSLEEAKEKIKQNTRNFSKRQMTWFRREADIHWIKNEEEALAKVHEFLT